MPHLSFAVFFAQDDHRPSLHGDFRQREMCWQRGLEPKAHLIHSISATLALSPDPISHRGGCRVCHRWDEVAFHFDFRSKKKELCRQGAGIFVCAALRFRLCGSVCLPILKMPGRWVALFTACAVVAIVGLGAARAGVAMEKYRRLGVVLMRAKEAEARPDSEQIADASVVDVHVVEPTVLEPHVARPAVPLVSQALQVDFSVPDADSQQSAGPNVLESGTASRMAATAIRAALDRQARQFAKSQWLVYHPCVPSAGAGCSRVGRMASAPIQLQQKRQQQISTSITRPAPKSHLPQRLVKVGRHVTA